MGVVRINASTKRPVQTYAYSSQTECSGHTYEVLTLFKDSAFSPTGHHGLCVLPHCTLTALSACPNLACISQVDSALHIYIWLSPKCLTYGCSNQHTPVIPQYLHDRHKTPSCLMAYMSSGFSDIVKGLKLTVTFFAGHCLPAGFCASCMSAAEPSAELLVKF